MFAQEVVDIWSPFSIITLRIVDWDRVTWFVLSILGVIEPFDSKLGQRWSRWLDRKNEQDQNPGVSKEFADYFDHIFILNMWNRH